MRVTDFPCFGSRVILFQNVRFVRGHRIDRVNFVIDSYTAAENQQSVGFILLASDKTTAKLVISLLNCKD